MVINDERGMMNDERQKRFAVSAVHDSSFRAHRFSQLSLSASWSRIFPPNNAEPILTMVAPSAMAC
jgi:hypothetical protein